MAPHRIYQADFASVYPFMPRLPSGAMAQAREVGEVGRVEGKFRSLPMRKVGIRRAAVSHRGAAS